jgi:hypothetical protein
MTSSKNSSARLLPVLFLSSGLFASCIGTGPHISNESSVPKTERPSKSDESSEKLAVDIEKKERELRIAELELEIAKQKAQSVAAGDQAAVESAQLELAKAERDLSHFREVEAPAKLAEEQLSLDNSEFRLQESRQEQEQMEAEYGPHLTDEQARKTGEIVIWRGQKRIEFAERRLELSRNSLAQLDGYELPARAGDLEQKVVEKREALARAREKAERGELENLVSVTKAENRIDLLHYELSKLRESAAKEQ